MKISVEKLKKDEGNWHEVQLSDEVEYSDDRITLIGPVKFTGQVKDNHDIVRIKGKLEVTYSYHCERCGAECTEHLSKMIDEEFSEQEEEDRFFYTGSDIILDDMVISIVLLSLAMQLLCKEDCKGICPSCYTNLNEQSCSCLQTNGGEKNGSTKA